MASSLSVLCLIGLSCVGYISAFAEAISDDRKDRAQHERGLLADSDAWYKRYPAYPPYCSTPEEMKTRTVPPLPRDKRFGETRLHHVTVIARHGARTPYMPGLNCWEDYATNPETSVWDCKLNSYLSPPPPAEVLIQEGMDSNHDEAMFLFEKRYDALQDPLSNLLGGTCQVGQLLLQGYEQEYSNGQYLRDAYVYDGGDFEHDARMRLLDVGSTTGTGDNVWDRIRYRVDDEMRTLMSGQIILRGLFGPELAAYFAKKQRYPVIPLHTADYSRDVLEPNAGVCPRLNEIRKRNEASPEFQAYNKSAEAGILRRFQTEVLEVPNPNADMDAIDCLMTTMCTDRALPAAVNDYRPSGSTEPRNDTEWSSEYGHDLLQRLFEFETKLYTINAKAEDGEYSKLGMSFLWKEIMTKINDHATDEAMSHEKLHLISGHDTTIIPLLAALGVWNDTTWPSYASMIVIELHELNIDGKPDRKIYSTDYAFRLIYNGAVITQQIKECPNDLDLCDLAILNKIVVVEGDCERKHADTVQYQDAVTRTREIISTPQGIIYLLLLVCGSAFAGGTLTFVYLTRGCSSVPRKQARYRHQEDASSYDESGNGYHDDSEDASERSLT
jgi:Histidine phosphatase superfamily (branch 2)